MAPLREMLAAALVIVAAILTAFPYTYTPRGFVQLRTPSPSTVLEYEKATGAYGLTTINEYLPQTVLELPKDLPAAISRPKIDLPAAAIRTAQWSPLGESDSVTLAAPMDVRFRTFNYPGWSVSVDDKLAPLTTLRDGTFTVAVPAGEHQLSARFEETALRLAANVLSLAGALGLVLMLLWRASAPTQVAPEAPAAERPPAGTPSMNKRKQITNPVRAGGRSAEGYSGATSVASPGYALSGLCLLLLVLFVAKTFVIDPQGLLRVSRFGQAVAVFDGRLELLGGQSDEGTVTRGGDVHARFFWRPALALAKDYHVFAQLIGADGNSIAGSDKQHPGDPVVQGETPTSQIALGSYLRDEHIIHVPGNAPPGNYELKVGLYDPLTGIRLKLPSGESMMGVEVIEVK